MTPLTTRSRPGLSRRILLGVLAYAALASLGVVVFGYLVHETAERTLWHALLEEEFDHLLARARSDDTYRWVDTDTLAFYSPDVPRAMPPALSKLRPGLHDDIIVNGRDAVVLVRDVDGGRSVLMLDISGLERREANLTLVMLGAMLILVVVLGFIIGWGADMLVSPLRDIAQRIGRLRPDRTDERIQIDDSASLEIAVIADALNDYLQRNAQFVERERAFIDSASHELRTPIAVIAGAAELASGQSEMTPSARQQLSRIRRTTRHIEHLIALLLVLAKDPLRLKDASDRIALDELLPDIVEDHRLMAEQKGLLLTLEPMPRCEVIAPMPVLQAAIGNLLRNAIENSDSGEIAIRLKPDAVVEIVDPGHGMSPEEISAIYARMARNGEREGSGIGLQLISRLCVHLGWTLEFMAEPGRGTTARLDFKPHASEARQAS